MRIRETLTCFSLATILCVASAFARERWISADRVVGVSIPEGWRRIDAFVSGPYLLAIGPPPESATRERPQLPVCSVEARTIQTRPMSQEEANALVESMLQPLLTQLRPTAVHATSVDLLAGVRVVSLDIDQQGGRGPTRQMQRIFAVPSDEGILQYQIGCGASGSAYQHTDFSVLHNFLSSLEVTPEAP